MSSLAIEVEWALGSSKSLLIYILVVYIGSISIVLFVLPVLLIIKILSLVLFCMHAHHMVVMHFLRSDARAVVKLWQDPDGHFGCQFRMGQSAYGKIKGDSFHTHLFVFLRLQMSNRVVHVLIPKDSLDLTSYLTLVARLRQF